MNTYLDEDGYRVASLPLPIERAIDHRVDDYHKQCRTQEGAERFICDWMSDPVEFLARIFREVAICEQDDELGCGLRDIVEREFRAVGLHQATHVRFADATGTPPYPWCSQPDVCIPKGYCPRDPNCGE